ncbi:hypothetical protein FIE12Z_1410 [Fusarium flagelliforme]|uniref:Uncharacterized protein n=1 Tax=Fusarium flagelliforme TaxID=2675880 RepID=A0A395N2F0_9HYPO|nr:hypothetical protein FIE12Z_1410 [Fusarium flagelliforme]
MVEPNAVYLMIELSARDKQLEGQAQDARRRKRYHEAEMKEQKAIIQEKDALIQSLQEQICALKGEVEMLTKTIQKNLPRSRPSLPYDPCRD